uniref:Uncharacterized protein n=1 Tax=Oryza nivara TaxID=4536 RepID=A0A0E0GI75_ORYNI
MSEWRPINRVQQETDRHKDIDSIQGHKRADAAAAARGRRRRGADRPARRGGGTGVDAIIILRRLEYHENERYPRVPDPMGTGMGVIFCSPENVVGNNHEGIEWRAQAEKGWDELRWAWSITCQLRNLPPIVSSPPILPPPPRLRHHRTSSLASRRNAPRSAAAAAGEDDYDDDERCCVKRR